MKLRRKHNTVTWVHGAKCNRTRGLKTDLRTHWCEATGDDELLFADGFDRAIIGTAQRCR